jgi:hypothetical protein
MSTLCHAPYADRGGPDLCVALTEQLPACELRKHVAILEREIAELQENSEGCYLMGMPTKRTSHRSSKGTKLYAVRDKKGQFEDIQTYRRAAGQSVKELRETTKRFSKAMTRLAKR